MLLVVFRNRVMGKPIPEVVLLVISIGVTNLLIKEGVQPGLAKHFQNLGVT